LRMLSHPGYWHRRSVPGWEPPVFHLVDTFLWLGFTVFLVWLADRHIPEVHQALRDVRPAVHEAVDTLRRWWNHP